MENDLAFCLCTNITHLGTGCTYHPCNRDIWAEHREHPPLGVIGELEAVAAVRFRVVLVGADQPHHLAVAVIDRALHAAVPLDAPDLPVEQVVGNAGLAPLVVRDLGQIARRVVAELRPVVDPAALLPVCLRNQAVGRVVLPQDLPAGGELDMGHIPVYIALLGHNFPLLHSTIWRTIPTVSLPHCKYYDA